MLKCLVNPRKKIREGISNPSRLITLVFLTTNQGKGIKNLINDLYAIRNARRLDVCGASCSSYENRIEQIYHLSISMIYVYII